MESAPYQTWHCCLRSQIPPSLGVAPPLSERSLHIGPERWKSFIRLSCFVLCDITPLQATLCVCFFHRRHSRKDIVLVKLKQSSDNMKDNTSGMLRWGATISESWTLSIHCVSRNPTKRSMRNMFLSDRLLIVFSVTNLCGMAPKLAELIRGWAFDGCFPVEDATSALFDGFFFSTFTLFRL